MLQQHALRTAINAPMQGSSADIIKKAMLDIHAWIDKENHQIKMFMQVHDELVFELDAKMADAYAIDIKALNVKCSQVEHTARCGCRYGIELARGSLIRMLVLFI